MYFFDNCTTLGEKQSLCDVFMWARKLHNPCISTIRALRRFILPDSIKNDRFKALTDRLQEKVKQPGEWYGPSKRVKRESNDTPLNYSTDRNVLHKKLLTNALECKISEN